MKMHTHIIMEHTGERLVQCVVFTWLHGESMEFWRVVPSCMHACTLPPQPATSTCLNTGIAAIYLAPSCSCTSMLINIYIIVFVLCDRLFFFVQHSQIELRFVSCRNPMHGHTYIKDKTTAAFAEQNSALTCQETRSGRPGEAPRSNHRSQRERCHGKEGG